MDKLRDLLEVHKLLLGHPNLANIRREIEATLANIDAGYAPKPPEAKPAIVTKPVSVKEVPEVERREI